VTGWRLERQPAGDWLLAGGGRCWRLAEAPARRWARSGRPDPELARFLAAAAPAPRRRLRWLWWTLPLLPPRVVRRLAAPLAALAAGPALAAAAAIGFLAAVAQQWWWPVTGAAGSRPAAVPAVLAAALAHELGHAAALRRAGYLPGGIGVGLLGIVPVFTCDVSAVNLLPRSHRLRVDLAGVAWQALAAGLLALLGGWIGRPALLLAADGAWLGVAWSLVPWGRNDGYWALRDLLETGAGGGEAGRKQLLRLLDLAVLVPALAWLAWLGIRVAKRLAGG